MLIAGAKGHAIEVLELVFNKYGDQLFFFDDVSQDLPPLLFGKYKIHTSLVEVAEHFQTDPEFVLGVGNPKARRKLAAKLKGEGGRLASVVSKTATVGSFNVNIGAGADIMDGVFISNNVRIGEGALLNARSLVHHDCKIGEYVEIGPGCIITGRCNIGDDTFLGAGSIVRPGVTIGSNVIVGAGSVVVNDISKGATVMGIPAKEKNK